MAAANTDQFGEEAAREFNDLHSRANAAAQKYTEHQARVRSRLHACRANLTELANTLLAKFKETDTAAGARAGTDAEAEAESDGGPEAAEAELATSKTATNPTKTTEAKNGGDEGGNEEVSGGEEGEAAATTEALASPIAEVGFGQGVGETPEHSDSALDFSTILAKV